MIHGRVTGRRTKTSLAHDIAAAANVDVPAVASGQSVAAALYPNLLAKYGLETTTSAYENFKRLLRHLGERYDPDLDSSELTPSGGGSTITARGLRKVLRGVSQEPQSFILNEADNPQSERYADLRGFEYGFDDSVSGRVALLAAGKGSRVVFYRTSNSTRDPRMAFVAHAEIASIDETEPGVYRAALRGYRELPTPVMRRDVAIEGWNVQVSIVEIEYEVLRRIVEAGNTSVGTPISPALGREIEATKQLDVVASSNDAPIDAAVVLAHSDPVAPQPDTPTDIQEPQLGQLRDEPEGWFPGNPPTGSVSLPERTLNRLAETRAVDIARTFFAAHGFELVRDRQQDGVGYDLELRDGAGRTVHAEIKGVRGDRLAFNLTRQEYLRAKNDPAFVVVAITCVLEPTSFHVHWLDSARLSEATPRLGGVRMVF